MRRNFVLFAGIALLPVAVQAPPAFAAQAIAMPVCGAGQGRVAVLPIEPDGKPGRNTDPTDCIKGCHAGGARKRGFEPEQ